MITVDWPGKLIFVPQSFPVDLGGGFYELDVDLFRYAVMALEDDGDGGMPHLHVFNHNAPVFISGVTYVRSINVINGYRVEFENGTYVVNLVGANNNLLDVRIVNSVSINPSNSAGAYVISGAGGGGGSDREPDGFR